VTGERLTQPRPAPRDGASAPAPTAQAADDPIAHFTDQAYNAILLAQDEARMLGQAAVAPEHLLLAAARRGNVERLLARASIDASAIHADVVRGGGLGRELALGPLPYTARSQTALREAIAAACARGIRGPSSEHLLLGLTQTHAAAILRKLGVADAAALVDRAYPVTRPPIDAATRPTVARKPPNPGPIPPVFERFSTQARDAVEAAVEAAQRLSNRYVQPAHLLLALLGGDDELLARVRASHQAQLDAVAARAVECLEGDSAVAHALAEDGRTASEDLRDPRGLRISPAPTGSSAARPGASSPKTCSRSRMSAAIARSQPRTCCWRCSRAAMRRSPRR
jgi:ClpA/ClpB-like protein